MNTINFAGWTKATGDLLPGQQRVFLDVLNLVAEGKAHLAYGADYRNGMPCLVNSVGQMLSTGGGAGVPSANFGDVVSQFDRLNGLMFEQGVNPKLGVVSELAAEFLIRNFGPLKDMVFEQGLDVKPEDTKEVKQPYVEPSDEQFMNAWLTALQMPAAEAEATPETVDDEQAVPVRANHGENA